MSCRPRLFGLGSGVSSTLGLAMRPCPWQYEPLNIEDPDDVAPQKDTKAWKRSKESWFCCKSLFVSPLFGCFTPLLRVLFNRTDGDDGWTRSLVSNGSPWPPRNASPRRLDATTRAEPVQRGAELAVMGLARASGVGGSKGSASGRRGVLFGDFGACPGGSAGNRSPGGALVEPI